MVDFWRGGRSVLASAVILMASIYLGGCAPRDPKVELATPEDTARSAGRILCAEHQQRIKATSEQIAATRQLQRAKEKLLGDSTQIERINDRLERFSDFFIDKQSELGSCRVVLIDLMSSEDKLKAHIALKIKFSDWDLKDDETFEVVEREQSLLLTMTHLSDEWKITASNRDLALPGGALQSLLD